MKAEGTARGTRGGGHHDTAERDAKSAPRVRAVPPSAIRPMPSRTPDGHEATP